MITFVLGISQTFFERVVDLCERRYIFRDTVEVSTFAKLE